MERYARNPVSACFTRTKILAYLSFSSFSSLSSFSSSSSSRYSFHMTKPQSALRLYNTFTKSEQDFAPIDPPNVRMYTCGPTVYSRPHIGNYSSFLIADLLRRWLEAVDRRQG